MLSFLNLVAESSEFVIFMSKKYKGLLEYFPKLLDRAFFIPRGKFLGFEIEKILNWNGLVTMFRWSNKICSFGFGELTNYRNLSVVAFRYKYIKKFMRTVKTKGGRFTDFQYFRYVVSETLQRQLPETGLILSSSEKLRHRANEYLSSVGYKPGKSVILAPYSFSLAGISNSESIVKAFTELSVFFNSLGFTVFTNTDEVNKEPIPGTKPISPPLELVKDIAQLCGFVVAYRSGLTHLIVASQAKLFVYYPEKKFSIPYAEYFSLKEFSSTGTLYEFTGEISRFVEFVKSFFA